MRILVEALGISKFGGGRSATVPLFEALLPKAADDAFTLLLEAFEPTLDYPNVRQVIIPIRNRFKARLWLQCYLPELVKQEKVDLVHFAKNLTVLGLGVKTLATIYDLALLRFPAGFPVADRLYWRFIQPVMLRKMTKVHAISQNTAKDLKRFYGLRDEQIRLIYPPYNLAFKPLENSQVEPLRQRYGLSEQTIMHIGSFGPKKNLETLVRAFGQLTDMQSSKLVLVGGPYRAGYDAPLKALVERLGLHERVIFTGIVPEEDLPGLINAASIVVYPSVYEGFGIAAVEALACGAPLIVNAGGALQEVVGDSALILQDPYDILALAEEMEWLCKNQELRADLRRRGLAHVNRFAPSTVAEQLLSLYRELAD
jgi:glycosyltransferase involved in cell wall biosynthesis